MSLNEGQSLAHYRIDKKIGEGGMGEVWSATDTRLNRSVAIKALPAAVAVDEMRLARFKREAQLLAALSHPNIGAIHGLEEVDGAFFLALELIEGEDLSTGAGSRRLSYEEVVEIALQIADALDAAHEKGIIHRDLKPANIKLGSDGQVKLLDFGLAKALSENPDDSFDSLELSTSPTLTAAMGTQAGMILGTAGYMAPEQARGKKVDRRADIWAFGVIVFELLTGERLYHGETVTDIIAAVVTRDPDWELLPSETPPEMHRLLRRCLQKDPRKRLRDIGDAALELREPVASDEASPAAAGATTSRGSAWKFGAVGILLGLVGALVIAVGLDASEQDAAPTWSNLLVGEAFRTSAGEGVQLSPDGQRVMFVAKAADGDKFMLWVRELSEERSMMLLGTEDAELPFWSPDSRSIAYFSNRNLRRISIDGGPPVTLDNVGEQPRGGHWGEDGNILFGPDWSLPIFVVSETGDQKRRVTELNKERLELSHRWPHLLPDGKHFLYYAVSTYPAVSGNKASEADKSGLYIGSLDGGEPKLLQAIPSRAVYRDGMLLYVDQKVLTSRPFDLDSLSFSGEPVSLAENVSQSADSLWGNALFSVSKTGDLLFVRGARETRGVSRLTWMDRTGKILEVIGDAKPYIDLRLSKDDSRVATTIGDPGDVWITDLKRGTETRFTFDPGNDDSPLWSPNGDQLIFHSSRLIEGKGFSPTNVYTKSSSGLGQEERLPIEFAGATLQPSSWSSDGKLISLTEFNPMTGSDISFYSIEDESRIPYLHSSMDELSAIFSPDRRWVTYTSNESGRYEVYVATYPEPSGKWQISNSGGGIPRWRADGRELYYATEQNDIMVVPIESGESFRHGTPVKLFDVPSILRLDSNGTWSPSADGDRFLFLITDDAEENGVKPVISLLQNWQRLLE